MHFASGSRRIPLLCTSSDIPSCSTGELAVCSASHPLSPPSVQESTSPESSTPETPTVQQVEAASGYDRVFWLGYLSNGLTTLANGMMVRYSDLVTSLGGDEQQLGLIVAAEWLAASPSGCFRGKPLIDMVPVRIWRWSLTIYSISLLLHMLLTTAYGPESFWLECSCRRVSRESSGHRSPLCHSESDLRRWPRSSELWGTSGFMGLMGRAAHQ